MPDDGHGPGSDGLARIRHAVEALREAQLERDAAVVAALAAGTPLADVRDCAELDEATVRGLERDWSGSDS